MDPVKSPEFTPCAHGIRAGRVESYKLCFTRARFLFTVRTARVDPRSYRYYIYPPWPQRPPTSCPSRAPTPPQFTSSPYHSPQETTHLLFSKFSLNRATSKQSAVIEWHRVINKPADPVSCTASSTRLAMTGSHPGYDLDIEQLVFALTKAVVADDGHLGR